MVVVYGCPARQLGRVCFCCCWRWFFGGVNVHSHQLQLNTVWVSRAGKEGFKVNVKVKEDRDVLWLSWLEVRGRDERVRAACGHALLCACVVQAVGVASSCWICPWHRKSCAWIYVQECAQQKQRVPLRLRHYLHMSAATREASGASLALHVWWSGVLGTTAIMAVLCAHIS